MKKSKFRKGMILSFAWGLCLIQGYQVVQAQRLCVDSKSETIEGVKDGYRYELWNQNSKGSACMTLGEGALFSGEWLGIDNYLARRGFGYDQTQLHSEIGSFSAHYKCNYHPNDSSGNSYLAVYGWTIEPLIEYYIIEDWCRWIPSMDKNATYKGFIEIDGSIYDIYENTRINQPSIVGLTTFQQYFSIRRDKRSKGDISISDHFKYWEQLGMELGNMYEVSVVVEGYKSKGSFEFKELELVVK